MPGLLTVSWDSHSESRANELFERARAGYTEFKGLTCNADVKEGNFRIARFAGRDSPLPGIFKDPESGVIAASAGWWFDRDTADDTVSDLRHLVQLYLSEGNHVFDHLQGQYCVALLDPRDRTLRASGDYIDMFPVYWAEGDGISWFSTSSIALARSLQPMLNVQAIRGYFMDGAIRSPQSAFDGIRQVGFGKRISLADGRAEITSVWTPYHATRSNISVPDATDEAVKLLRQNCRHVRATYPNWICDLTSGLDTRMVMAGMAEPGVDVNVVVNGDDDYIDVVVASEIAGHFGWPLVRGGRRASDWAQRRWSYFKKAVALADGKLIGSKADATVKGKETLSQQFSASLNGGAAAVYRDFLWQQEFFKIGKTSDVDLQRLFRYRFFFNARPDMRLFRSDWRADYLSDQARIVQTYVDLAPEALNTVKLDLIFLWQMTANFAGYMALTFPIIQSVLPLGTSDWVEAAISLPYKYRMGGDLTRRIITRAYPELAKFRTWYGGTAQPIRLTHPGHYLSYRAEQFKKLVRKFGQLTIKKPIFKDPCTRRPRPEETAGFVRCLQDQGMLEIDNLVTAGLFQPDGLRKFLSEVKQGDMSRFPQLCAVLSLDVLCKQVGISPSGYAI